MKVPHKYWIIPAVILTLINLVAFIFFRQPVANGVVDSYTKNHPYLDPYRQFEDQKDLIVNLSDLRKYLKSLPDQNKDWADMNIYFEVMSTGANISINNDEKLYPASLLKLPIGMIAMKRVEKGEWNLDGTKLTLVPEDADSHTPDVQNMIGKSFTLRDLLDKLLLDSDNTAYHMIVRELTEDELSGLANSIGLEEFLTADQKISAKDYTRLLRALYSASYLDEDHSQQLLELLVRSNFNRFIKTGIPDNVMFAHKWGLNDTQDVYADSGIMYIGNRPVMISVIIQGKTGDQPADQTKAEALMKDIGSHVYDYISKQ